MTTRSSATRLFKYSLWLVAVALSMLVFGCSASKQADVPAPPPPPPADLRVGVWPDFPPFAMKSNGKLEGVEVAFAEKLGPALKRRVRIVELDWNELIPALRDGRIDVIMSGMSVTDDRKRLVNFAEPYYHVGQMALIRKADEEKLENRAAVDQPKIRIGFQKDTTGEYFVRDQVKQAKLVGFDSIDGGINALRKNKIDIFVHDAPTIWRITGGFSSKEKQLVGRYQFLTDEALAWAVRLEDDQLRDQLSDQVKKWQRSGEIDQVLDRWIPVRKKTIKVQQ